MDSLDNGRERFAASEQPTEAWKPQTHARDVPTCPGERRRRWWPLAWLSELGFAVAGVLDIAPGRPRQGG